MVLMIIYGQAVDDCATPGSLALAIGIPGVADCIIGFYHIVEYNFEKAVRVRWYHYLIYIWFLALSTSLIIVTNDTTCRYESQLQTNAIVLIVLSAFVILTNLCVQPSDVPPHMTVRKFDGK